MIDAQDIKFISELFGDVCSGPVDLMLESTGGITDAAEGIISLISNLCTDFRTIVVQSAKSNGTLICLSSKSIVMGASSELGPIEPSVNGIPCTILSDPEVAKTNFVLHKQGKFALEQSKKIAKHVLSNGMMADKKPEEIDLAVSKLSSRDTYASHGAVIHHREASDLGLKIDYLPPDDEVWKRLWLLYCMYEYDCRKSRFLKVYEGAHRSTAVAAPPLPSKP
jgi:hypothetical protein